MSMGVSKKPWWILGVVNKGSYGWKKTIFVAWGPGPDGPQSSARRKCFKKIVSRVRSVSHNLNRPLHDPGSVQVLKRWKVASDYLLSRANNTFQSAFFLSSGSSIPDGNGGSENGLNDGSVEINHHCLWQVKLLQLPQEIHPLLCFFN